MATHTSHRFAALVLGSILAASSRAHADDIARIRIDDPHLQTVLDDVARRSPLLVAIIRTVGASDVIVHVTCVQFAVSTLEGRTLLVSANRDARYLRVQIDCMLPRGRLVTILAHELQHVAEVAAAREVVDQRSFARLFRTIGFSTCVGSVREQFETDAALAVGQQVWRESAHRPASVRARLEDR